MPTMSEKLRQRAEERRRQLAASNEQIDIGSIEEVLDTADAEVLNPPTEQPATMSPEAIAAAEAEKAALVLMTRAKSTRATAALVADVPLVIPDGSEAEAALVAARAEVEGAQADLLAVAQEQVDEEKHLEEELARIRTARSLKSAAIEERKQQAASKVHVAERRLAGVELAQRAARIAREAEEAKRQEQANKAAKDAELRRKLEPLVAQARKALAGLRAFDERHGGLLRRLAESEAPRSWPGLAQVEYSGKVVDKAQKLVRSLDTDLGNRAKKIFEAERMIERGWVPGGEWFQELHQVEWELSLGVTAEHFHSELIALSAVLRDIQPEADQLGDPSAVEHDAGRAANQQDILRGIPERGTDGYVGEADLYQLPGDDGRYSQTEPNTNK